MVSFLLAHGATLALLLALCCFALAGVLVLYVLASFGLRVAAFVLAIKLGLGWLAGHKLPDRLDVGDRRVRSTVYTQTMESPAWRRRRALALRRSGHRCQRCGTAVQLDVHHVTYTRLGHERPGDLRVLCRSCHDREHTA